MSVSEVRPLREKMQNLQVEYNDKKMSFNSTSAGLESNTTKLEQDVKVTVLLIFLEFVLYTLQIALMLTK